MSKFYIWCRAWPWYTPGFPFEKVETLSGVELTQALDQLALEWHAKHPGVMDNHRKKMATLDRLQTRGTGAINYDSGQRAALKQNTELAPDFREVAALAGWVRGHPMVVADSTGPLGPYTPQGLLYFYATTRHDVAEVILEVLRERNPIRRAHPHLAMPEAIIRHGATDGSVLSPAQRVAIELRIADYRKLLAGLPGAKDTLSTEAATIERHYLEGDTQEPVLAPDPVVASEEQQDAPESEGVQAAREPLDDEDEQNVRQRIQAAAQQERVIRVLRKVKALEGEFVRANEIVACGISGRTLNSAAQRWDSVDVRNRGKRELAYRRLRVLQYIVMQWDPR